MSLTHDLLMMGPVGTALEDISDAAPDDTWFEHGGEQWTVEMIGRTAYAFALDDVWTDAGAAPQKRRTR